MALSLTRLFRLGSSLRIGFIFIISLLVERLVGLNTAYSQPPNSASQTASKLAMYSFSTRIYASLFTRGRREAVLSLIYTVRTGSVAGPRTLTRRASP
jgi:hypothetical protein